MFQTQWIWLFFVQNFSFGGWSPFNVRHENEVPLWSVDDVESWVNRVGFQDYAATFRDCGVDGDMLLQLTDQDIKDDIGITNGILRKRFMRELRDLKKNADYTSCDGGLMANF